MTRILSQHGNVISADFRPRRRSPEGSLEFETLYCDGNVIVTRCEMYFDGRCMMRLHFLADLATGDIVNL